jgi:hypothetical protein
MEPVRIEHLPSNVKHLTTLAGGTIAFTTKDDDGRPLETIHLTDLSGSYEKGLIAEVVDGLAGSPTNPEKLAIVGRNEISIVNPGTNRLSMIVPEQFAFEVISQGNETDHTLAWSWDGKLLAVVGQGLKGSPGTGNMILIFDKDLNLISTRDCPRPIRHLSWLFHNRAVSYYLEGENDTHFFHLGPDIAPELNVIQVDFSSNHDPYLFTGTSNHWPDKDTLVLFEMECKPTPFLQYSKKDGVRFRWSSWSPDGRWLMNHTSEPNELRIYSLDAMDLKTVSHPTINFWEATPVWTKDSSHLLFVTSGGVYALRVELTDPTGMIRLLKNRGF